MAIRSPLAAVALGVLASDRRRAARTFCSVVVQADVRFIQEGENVFPVTAQALDEPLRVPVRRERVD